MDCFSKYCWLVPLTSKTSAMVSKALQNIFTQYGCPEKLQSDNGGEFVSHVVEELCLSLKIRIIHGRPYHPQSQGQVERLNKKIRRILRYRLLDFFPRGTIYSLAISFARDCLHFEQQLAQCTLCYSFWSFLWKVLPPVQHCRQRWCCSMAFSWIYDGLT